MSGEDGTTRSHYDEAVQLLEDAFTALENGNRAVEHYALIEASVRAQLALVDVLRELLPGRIA